jgi:hypothetical protein
MLNACAKELTYVFAAVFAFMCVAVLAVFFAALFTRTFAVASAITIESEAFTF